MRTYYIICRAAGVVLDKRFAHSPIEALGDFARGYGFAGYFDMAVTLSWDYTFIETREIRDERDSADLLPCSRCSELFLVDHPNSNFHTDGVHWFSECPQCAKPVEKILTGVLSNR